eukprot:8602081-Lingulodinium_polyedra.AAC.1
MPKPAGWPPPEVTISKSQGLKDHRRCDLSIQFRRKGHLECVGPTSQEKTTRPSKRGDESKINAIATGDK